MIIEYIIILDTYICTISAVPGVAGSQLDGKTDDIKLLRQLSNKDHKCLTSKYKQIWFDILRTQWCAKDLK